MTILVSKKAGSGFLSFPVREEYLSEGFWLRIENLDKE
jgi:hypothetical protein